MPRSQRPRKAATTIGEPAGKKRQVMADIALEHLNEAIGLAIVEANEYKALLNG